MGKIDKGPNKLMRIKCIVSVFVFTLISDY